MDPTSTKARVLDAAAKVFLANGFDAASMDQVRQEAGVSNGSLYHHFPTKAQLADALYAQTLRDFHGTMMAPLKGGRVSAEKGVKAMVRLYADWVVAHPGRARLLHELKRNNGLAGSDAETEQANAEALGFLREWIAKQVEAGEMRDVPFGVWMAIVFGPAMQMTRLWVKQAAVAPKVRAALEHAAWMAVAP